MSLTELIESMPSVEDTAAMVSASTVPLRLPDISEFQPNADISGIKRVNGGAAIIRVCYGTSHPDHFYVRHRAESVEAGYKAVGLYQYLVKSQDVSLQANAFCDLVGKLAPWEFPVLDYEERAFSVDQLQRALKWLRIVEGKLGKRPWVYSGAFFAVDAGLAPLFNGNDYHTWVAAYGSVEPALGHTLWQSTDGRIGSNITDWPGAGRCDTSVYHGSIADLAALVNPGANKPPKPPSGKSVKEHEHVTGGRWSLASFAVQQGTSPAAILRHTAVRLGAFDPDVADYVNDIFRGKIELTDPMPAGLHLWVPGLQEKE
jgi:hypothetical protein